MLLTSAFGAIDLAGMQNKGYQIWAVSEKMKIRTAVRAIYVPRKVSGLSETDDWLHANLGLIETEVELPTVFPFATQDDLRNLEEGLPVGCCGFSYNLVRITRFDKFEPQWFRGEVFVTGSTNRLGEEYRLLEFLAKLPENTYGSPVVNQQGRLVGVYGWAPNVEPAGVKDLRYAAIPSPELFQSPLEKLDNALWIRPVVQQTVSDSPESDGEQ